MKIKNMDLIVDSFRHQFELRKEFASDLKYNENVFFEILESIQNMVQYQFSYDEQTYIKKHVDSIFQIYQPSGVILVDPYDHNRDWYSSLKKIGEFKSFYWSRYRKYLFKKGWTSNVLDTLDNVTLDTLMNYLGNPHSTEPFSRKGLVMGDVQSGKTSNYIGLITKAADAGYKVIILLTGTLESLRRQTQIRVEEGFIGYDVETKEWVGVGNQNIKDAPIPKSITSRASDFTGDKGETTMLQLNQEDIPFIFVTKKNVSTLKKIRGSIQNINLRPPQKVIDTSLLIIDDEADNASINTNKADNDPSKINAEIRELLNLFSKSNYVGFTATPFANVFIDPNSESEMLKEDLFPNDFIYGLNPPSNYFGLKKIFDDKKHDTVQPIRDYNDDFKLKHKKDWQGDKLFESLIEAINAFLIINVIRDFYEKGNNNSHRSMLINVSRFISVQERFEELVSNEFQKIMNSIRHGQFLDNNEALKNKHIYNLYTTYIKYYGDEYSWKEIFKNIYESNKYVEIYKIPFKDKKKKLDYDKHEKNGLRVIVIGGLALSRGLTLEGLTISYLYRTTATFDVLLQMGRWFGYRDKPKSYEHLCKIWMPDKTNEYFQEISRSIRSLKTDFEKLVESGKSPVDFGIRVRNESDELGITSRNKMRNAKKYIYINDHFGRVFETPFIDINENDIKNNQELLYKFIIKNKFEKVKKVLISKMINTSEVIHFLENFEIHEANTINYFEKQRIIEFILDHYGTFFDVVIIGGDGKVINFGNEEINFVERSFDVLDNKVIRINGSRRRLGGPQDTRHGLNSEDLKKAKLIYGEKSNKDFLIDNRNPLLLIYPIQLKKVFGSVELLQEEVSFNNRLVDEFNEKGLFPVGVALGFPRSTNGENYEKNIYYINLATNWQDIMYEKDNDEDD